MSHVDPSHAGPKEGFPAQREPRRARSRRVQVGTAGLAGLLALTGVGASAASAAAKPMARHATSSTSHKKSAGKSSTSSALAAVENQLGALEKLAPKGTTVSETGSTLFYPLYQEWQKVAPLGLTINPQGTGSGTGIASAAKGTIDIGASDAYLPPGTASNLLDIPIVLSAQQINYNIPGLEPSTHLKLDATILNGIYTGKITHWNDPAIKALNKGVSLPSLAIVPLKRSDGSGDTFLFTSYLSYGDKSSFAATTTGPTTSTTAFPAVAGEQSELGNQGMLDGCVHIKGCIAYIGVSYLREAHARGLGNAAMLNGWTRKGSPQYVLPTPANIGAEVASFKKVPASGALSLIFSHSTRYGYPLVNFEYAIVNKNQPNTATANAIKALLAWGADPRHGAATSFLSTIYFQPLAPNALAIAVKLLKSIH